MKEEKKENIPEKEDVDKSLEKQFQEMDKAAAAPADLKNEVFNTLDALILFGDITDLFTSKFTEAEAKIIDAVSDSDEKKEQDKKEK